MKKTILLFMLAVTMMVCKMFAQSMVVATLTHEGTTTEYYGALGLTQAHEAAIHGDVITLSSGTFTACDITKAVTIRGAGMKREPISGIGPTIINGDFGIQISNDIPQKLTMEGIYTRSTLTYKGILEDASFLHCRLGKVTGEDDARIVKGNFIHSVIVPLCLTSFSSAYCLNSIVWDLQGLGVERGSDSTAILGIDNCLMYIYTIYEFGIPGIYQTMKNSIILQGYQWALHEENHLYNCLSISGRDAGNLYLWIDNGTNMAASMTVFKNPFKLNSWELGQTSAVDYTTYNDEFDFTLTDAAKSKYLGADGTEVGIYGGSMPFDQRPSYMRFTSFDVASKTTNGTLPVKIELENEE